MARLFIVLAVCTSTFLAACAASTSPGVAISSQSGIDGVSLYEKYCADCHKPFEKTTKPHSTAKRLRSAINIFPSMQNLNFLSDAQLEEVAAALATSYPQHVSRRY